MKSVLFGIFFSCTSISFGQLISGPLMEEGRKLVTPFDFLIIDNFDGILFFEVAVDRKGNVTSARLIPEKTTVSSTPTRIRIRNSLMNLKFQEGTYYPEFHHVLVKVTVEKGPVGPIIKQN